MGVGVTFIAGCSGKKHFTRFTLANKAAARRNRRDGGAHLEAYHCRNCNGFHVGESRAYKQRDRRREDVA
jgi:hypothetical protein